MIKRPILPLFVFILLFSSPVLTVSGQASTDATCYELRIYDVASGRLDEVVDRFKRHQVRLLERHGIEVFGLWTPSDFTVEKFVYLIAFPSCEERTFHWDSFRFDDDFRTVLEDTPDNETLLSNMESIKLLEASYSPPLALTVEGSPRVFELRSYTTPPWALKNLHQRFSQHTLSLFEKHGMTNIGYWSLTDDEEGAEYTLIYLLAHDSDIAAQNSWEAFIADPEWLSVKEASEKEGELVIDIQSIFLVPTDFSPIQ